MLNIKNHHFEIRYGFKPKRAQSTTAVTKLKDTGKETVRNTRAQPSTKTARWDTHTHTHKSSTLIHIRSTQNKYYFDDDFYYRWFVFVVVVVSPCMGYLALYVFYFHYSQATRQYENIINAPHIKTQLRGTEKKQLKEAKWQRQWNKK